MRNSTDLRLSAAAHGDWQREARASLGEMRPDAIDHHTVAEPPARPLPPKVRLPAETSAWAIRPIITNTRPPRGRSAEYDEYR